MIYWMEFFICYGVSFMTLGAISCERRLRINVAVSFPFSNLVPRVLSVGENSGNEVVRFQEFVRRERISKTAVFIWLVNLLFTCLEWANWNHIFKGIHLCLWLASLVIAFSAQCKILLISLRHQFKSNDITQEPLPKGKCKSSSQLILRP